MKICVSCGYVSNNDRAMFCSKCSSQMVEKDEHERDRQERNKIEKEQKLQADYEAACKISESSNSIQDFQKAVDAFSALADYKDSKTILSKCQAKLNELQETERKQKQKDNYTRACELGKRAQTSEELREVIQTFEKLGDYEESTKLLEHYRKLLKEKRNKHIKIALVITASVASFILLFNLLNNLLIDNKFEQESTDMNTIHSTESELTIPVDDSTITVMNHPTTFQIGITIEFGGYDWRVLDIQNDNALLLSEYIIECRAFHNERVNITWDISDIRTYLNNDFYNTFNMEEKARIMEMNIVNNNCPWFNTYGGLDTIDRVFLLSIEDVVKYFGDSGQLSDKSRNDDPIIDDQFNEERIAYRIDDESRQNGERSYEDSWWWLRAPSYNSYNATVVGGDGCIYVTGGPDMTMDIGGVRPAI